MKVCKCSGCGAVIPVNDAAVDPFYHSEVLCVVCEREWIEDQEGRREDEDAAEVERVCREVRYLWD